MKPQKVALIGERDLDKPAHQGIEASLAHYRCNEDPSIEYEWVNTASITKKSIQAVLSEATAVWCTPGSPYENLEGALIAIKHARTEGTAFLGTCGGFQHAIMEFSQNVLSRAAPHQEVEPEALNPLIVKLSCSLIGATGLVMATSPDRFSALLGGGSSVEEFNCNYGFNTELSARFEGTDLEFVAHDESGQIRRFD